MEAISVEDDHRANRIGVEPTTAEAKDLTSLRRIQSATHNWAIIFRVTDEWMRFNLLVANIYGVGEVCVGGGWSERHHRGT